MSGAEVVGGLIGSDIGYYAGGAAGGAIGELFGPEAVPVGAWIGSQVGSIGGRVVGSAAGGLISNMANAGNKPPKPRNSKSKEKLCDDCDEEDGNTQAKPPAGSRPIDQTDWSGDHQQIKEGIGAGPTDNTSIDPDGNVWGQNADGSWTNHGPAGTFTGSGKPSGK